jgi:hypothetical protein
MESKDLSRRHTGEDYKMRGDTFAQIESGDVLFDLLSCHGARRSRTLLSVGIESGSRVARRVALAKRQPTVPIFY